MSKKTLSPEQKRLDTDIWIIALVTLAVFCLYAAMGNQLTQFVLDSGRPIFPRLLVNAGIQYGVAGLGITIVCILRREAFSSFGLRKEQAGKAVLGTILVFLPLLCCRYLSGQIEGWQPFSILITEDVLNSGFPLSVLGMAVIILVWGFFEGLDSGWIWALSSAPLPVCFFIPSTLPSGESLSLSPLSRLSMEC